MHNKNRIEMTKLRVKEICKEKGMTLAALADKMGVTASAVTQYLKSDNLSLGTLLKLSSILGVKLDDLIVKDECNITGFVDVDGKLYRINNRENIANLLAEVDAKEQHKE